MQLRVVALELAEEERDKVGSRTRGRADCQSAVQNAVACCNLVEELLLERQETLRAPVEAPPRLRRFDAPS